MRPVVFWGRLCLVVALAGIAASTPAVAQTCAPPPAGFIAWWSGQSDAQDVSGHKHHAQLRNGAQAGVPGKVGNALQFDGVDDVAQTSLILPPQGTIELWVHPTTLTGTHGIIGTFGRANGNDRLWVVVTGPGGGPGVGPHRLVVNLGSCCVNDIDIPNPLALNAWSHVALSFDYSNDSYAVYINGQVAITSTAPRNVPTQPFSVGAVDSDFGQSFFFPGLLDEVTVYNRVLEPAEVLTIFNASSAGKCPPSDNADLCFSTHTSGTGATFLQFCISGNGNLMQFESPYGFQHIHAEGYAVCSGTPSQTHGHDAGDVAVGFGPTTITQPNGPHTFPLTITRNTTDGVLQLKQTFSRDPTEHDVIITMALKNLSSTPVTDVLLTRYVDGDISGDGDDDMYDFTSDSMWGKDADGLAGYGLMLTALTFGTPHSFVPWGVETFAAWSRETCLPQTVQPTPTPPGDYVGRATYQLGTINPGRSKTVKVLYRRF